MVMVMGGSNFCLFVCMRVCVRERTSVLFLCDHILYVLAVLTLLFIIFMLLLLLLFLVKLFDCCLALFAGYFSLERNGRSSYSN
jgi:hypothetical protein